MAIPPQRDDTPGSAKYQHFVHRAYLAQFVDPDSRRANHEPYLWVFDNPRDPPKKRAPKNVAGEANLYNFQIDDGVWSADVENRLSSIEDRGLRALNRLAALGEREHLSDEEQQWLAAYLALTQARLPSRRDAFQQFEEELLDGVSKLGASQPAYFHGRMKEIDREGYSRTKVEEAREAILAGHYQPHSHPNTWLKLMLESIVPVGEMIAGLQWTILKAPAGDYFITSDAPLIVTVPYELPALSTAGWAMSGVEAVLAISPQFAIALTQHLPERRLRVSRYAVREVNSRVGMHAQKQIYSSSPKPIGEVADYRPVRNWPKLAPNGTPPLIRR